MTLLSLICLLALSSAAFGRSVQYGGYGATTLSRVAPIEMNTGYGHEIVEPKLVQGAYGSALVSQSRVLPSTFSELRTLEVEPTIQTLPPAPLTQADLLCRGKLPETVIPIDGNTRFVTCLDDGKGVEQECQKGLLYNEMTRRCERRLGPQENFCASQPCFNGGQCIPTDSWFTCQCPAGFDGPTCELDARVCHTQQPCGSSPDTICQSFRLGAALDYICIFQDGFSYGLNSQQTHANPCTELSGPHALAVSSGGFIMCNGDRMHVESCPGGTFWDKFNRACSWPDMITGEPSGRLLERSGSNYGEQRVLKTGYGAERVFTPKVASYGGYGAERVFTPKVASYGGYGAERVITPKVAPTYGGYGAERVITPKVIDNYGAERVFTPKVASYGGYGAERVITPKVAPTYGGYGAERVITPKVIDNYGAERVITPKVIDNYGAERIITPKLVDSYGAERIITPKLVDSYGAERTLVRPRVMNNYGAERTLIAPKTFDNYGSAEKTVITQKITDTFGGEQTLLN